MLVTHLTGKSVTNNQENKQQQAKTIITGTIPSKQY